MEPEICKSQPMVIATTSKARLIAGMLNFIACAREISNELYLCCTPMAENFLIVAKYLTA